MANLQVDDLPLIPAVDNADMYAAKSNLDYRVRTGEPNGLATLDGSGKIPVGQLPVLNFLPLTGGTLSGTLNVRAGVVGNQQGMVTYGWNNGIIRWNHVVEASAALSVYSYDAGGGNAQQRLSINNTTGAVDIPGALSTGPLTAGSVVTSTVAASGAVTASSVTASLPAQGLVSLTPGNLALCGFIEFKTPDTTRRGFLGWGSGTNVVYQMENGWGLVFDGGAVRFNSTAPVSHFNTESHFVGAVATQANMRSFGWNNGVVRWREFIETDASQTYYSYDSGGGFVGRGITWTPVGVVTSVNFVATSDERLKENIVDTKARRLQHLLRFVEFDWKYGDKHHDRGLIAQEVQKYAPEYIHSRPDGELAVDKIGLLLECVVSMAAEIRELKEKK